MEAVAFVAGIALLEYWVFVFLAGQARGKHGVAAPAIIGNQIYERYYRVQLNTVEQLVIFLPALALFAVYVNPPVAAGCGVVFIVGRAMYARGYVQDPAKRGPGFALTLLANAILLLGGLIGALVAWL